MEAKSSDLPKPKMNKSSKMELLQKKYDFGEDISPVVGIIRRIMHAEGDLTGKDQSKSAATLLYNQIGSIVKQLLTKKEEN